MVRTIFVVVFVIGAILVTAGSFQLLTSAPSQPFGTMIDTQDTQIGDSIFTNIKINCPQGFVEGFFSFAPDTPVCFGVGELSSFDVGCNESIAITETKGVFVECEIIMTNLSDCVFRVSRGDFNFFQCPDNIFYRQKISNGVLIQEITLFCPTGISDVTGAVEQFNFLKENNVCNFTGLSIFDASCPSGFTNFNSGLLITNLQLNNIVACESESFSSMFFDIGDKLFCGLNEIGDTDDFLFIECTLDGVPVIVP